MCWHFKTQAKKVKFSFLREKMIYRREKNQFSNFFNNSRLRTIDLSSPKSFNGEEMRAVGKGFHHETIYYTDQQSHNDKTHK
jgi:hypothetical protein